MNEKTFVLGLSTGLDSAFERSAGLRGEAGSIESKEKVIIN